jgi:exopolysaccharide biosynthesis predicted pyruvyltransferase EpsI
LKNKKQQSLFGGCCFFMGAGNFNIYPQAQAMRGYLMRDFKIYDMASLSN